MAHTVMILSRKPMFISILMLRVPLTSVVIRIICILSHTKILLSFKYMYIDGQIMTWLPAKSQVSYNLLLLIYLDNSSVLAGNGIQMTWTTTQIASFDLTLWSKSTIFSHVNGSCSRTQSKVEFKPVPSILTLYH